MLGLIAAGFAMQVIEGFDFSDARMIHSPSVNAKGVPYSKTCADWTSARMKKNRRAAQLEAWVVGVVTGYNLYHPKSDHDKLDLLDGNSWGKESQSFFRAIDERCGKSPSAVFPEITVSLIAEWRKR